MYVSPILFHYIFLNTQIKITRTVKTLFPKTKMELCITPNAEFRWSVALEHVFSEATFILSQCAQVCRVLESYHEWDMKQFGTDIKYDLSRDPFYYKQKFHCNNCTTLLHVNMAMIIYV